MSLNGIYSAVEALWILAPPMLPWNYHSYLLYVLVYSEKFASRTASAYGPPERNLGAQSRLRRRHRGSSSLKANDCIGHSSAESGGGGVMVPPSRILTEPSVIGLQGPFRFEAHIWFGKLWRCMCSVMAIGRHTRKGSGTETSYRLFPNRTSTPLVSLRVLEPRLQLICIVRHISSPLLDAFSPTARDAKPCLTKRGLCLLRDGAPKDVSTGL